MEGALTRLLRAIVEGGATARAAERKVGEGYTRAAADESRMFQRGPSFARTDDGLEQQFGTRIDRSMGPEGALVWTDGAARGPASWQDYSFADMAGAGVVPHMTRREFNRFPLGTTFREFDTSQMGTATGQGGGGAGRSAYATLFGALVQDPSLMNVSSSLSGRNQHRRNFNQAAAILREPRLSKQIIADPSQFREAGMRDPMEFLRRAPSEQLGALQTEGALQTMSKVRRTARHSETYDTKRGDLQSIIDYLIPFEEDPLEFVKAANLLRRSGADPLAYDTVGASALRKAAIVDDIFNNRTVRKSLLPGLEFRRGGSVQRR